MFVTKNLFVLYIEILTSTELFEVFEILLNLVNDWSIRWNIHKVSVLCNWNYVDITSIFLNIDGELTRGGTNDDEQTKMTGDTDSQIQTNPDGEKINLPFLCILMLKAPTTFYQFFISKSSAFFFW